MASSRTRCELSLFLRIDSIADGAPTVTLSGAPSTTLELVDHREVGRIRHDDDQRLAFAPVRHEAVAQHQVRRNRPEQFLVDAELVHVDEFETIALRQLLGVRDLLESSWVWTRLSGSVWP